MASATAGRIGHVAHHMVDRSVDPLGRTHLVQLLAAANQRPRLMAGVDQRPEHMAADETRSTRQHHAHRVPPASESRLASCNWPTTVAPARLWHGVRRWRMISTSDTDSTSCFKEMGEPHEQA
jgi:hypothetical protein